jgi:hypothetical protein
MNDSISSTNKSVCANASGCNNEATETTDKKIDDLSTIKLCLFRCVKCYKIIALNPNKLDENGNLVPLDLDSKCHFCFDFDVINESDKLTTNRLSEELFLHMRRTQHIDQVTGDLKRSYLEQAKTLMLRMPLCKPTPVFTVHLSDIQDNKIKRELAALNDAALDNVMRTAIGLVFECVNERQYNLSTRNLLRWEIGD